MTAKVCRIGDAITGTCQANATGHPRTFTGVWKVGSNVIMADGIGVVRVGDTGLTDCNHTILAVAGSSIVDDRGAFLVRVGDAISIVEGGYGVTTTGSPSIDSL